MDNKKDNVPLNCIKDSTTQHIIRVAVSILFLALGAQLLFPEPTLSAAVAPSEKRPFVQDEILVRFKDGIAEQAKANAHAQVGGRRVKEFKKLRGLELVKIPPTMSVEEAIQLYSRNPNVLYAEPNYIAKAQAIPNDPSFSSLWGLQKINAPGAWDLSVGSSGVVVATVDTGVDYNHQDLAANMWRNPLDCNNNGIDDDGNGYVDDCYGIDTYSNDADPLDDEGHGTHIAGTIGAVGNNTVGVVGVNWNVSIMACKFIGAGGTGPISAAVSCLEYITLMKERGVNIVAVNASYVQLGGGASQAEFDAITALWQAGILFIACAGNDGTDNDLSPQYPASHFLPNVISVAGTNSSDNLGYFPISQTPKSSNYGKRTVHLGAPGTGILSTTRENTYSNYWGTSMAVSHVSGVAALLKAYNPQLDWKAIKNLILAGGDTVSGLVNTITQKRLNARGALLCTNPPVVSRVRPTGNRVSTSIGMPVNLAALHINCANPNGNVSVTVSPGNQIVTLLDNGSGFDQQAGDGIYSGQWIPNSGGTYTLTFPGGDVLTVDALKNYRFQSLSAAYRTITGTNLNLGDDSAALIDSPFPIRFGGGSFNQVHVSSNGNLNFTAPFTSYFNSSIPTSSIATLVAPFWDDLFPVSGSSQNVFWAVTGSAPTRELVVEWRDVRHGSCRTDAASVKFQVVFFEGNSNILFNYADTSFGGNCKFASGGGSATIGVQIAGDVGTQFSYNSSSLNKTKGILWTLIDDPNFPAPTLSAPADGAIRVSTTPTFSWSAVTGATSYRIMVATTQAALPLGPWVTKCAGCVINSTSTNTSFTPTTALSRGTLYYWQVKAEGNSGQPGTWSAQWSFTTDSTLLPPTLSAPANGATGVSSKPSFSWFTVSGASGYRIMAATSQTALTSDPSATTCSSCVVNATSPSTSYTPTTALAVNTVHYWQVRAEGSSGGYWSIPWSFTTENIFPPPILSGPSNGAIGVPTTPTFRWLTVSGAPQYRIMVASSPSILPTSPTSTRCNKCTINTTSTSTTFTSTTPLSSGTVYYWQVRAEGTSGQGGYWSQQRSFTTIPPNSGVATISSPAPATAINDFSVLVRGYVNVPVGTEFGVTVNGYVAFVDLAEFAVEVPVDESVTSLTVTVKNSTGAILGSDAIPVTVQLPTTEPTLLFRPSPVVGPAPLTVGFTLTSLEPISRIDLDADGDGTVDFQGTSLDSQQLVYPGPGLYYPKVAVTDTANNTYTKTAILLVMAQSELENLLQSKWTGLKNALRNNDISTALNYIAVSQRSLYEAVFNSLTVPLTQIDQVLTSITFIEMTEATAEYEMLRIGADGEIAYLVRFNIDEGGIWRIRDF